MNDDDFNPYEGVIVARPITPLPDDRRGGVRFDRDREAIVVPLTFARARIHWRWVDNPVSYEDGW